MIKLIVFDLDGTLVDTAEDIFHAANEFLASLGKPPLTFKEVRDHIGQGFSQFVRDVAGVDEVEKLDEVFNGFQVHYDKRLTKDSKFFEGADHFMRDVLNSQKYKLAILSNKPEYQVRKILVEFGFKESDFVEIFGGDRFPKRKPDPQGMLELMKIAGVKPSETVMVGDSHADVEVAKNARTHFVGVTFGYNSREKLSAIGARFFIDHYGELHDIVEEIIHAFNIGEGDASIVEEED